jgi:hypothetical protein
MMAYHGFVRQVRRRPRPDEVGIELARWWEEAEKEPPVTERGLRVLLSSEDAESGG